MNSKNMLVKLLSIMIVFGVLLTACGSPATATEAPAAPAAPARQKHQLLRKHLR